MVPSWLPWVDLALGAIEVALLLAAVYLTVAQFTRSRASSYIERFNSSDALESRIAVERWLRDHPTTKQRLDALERDPQLQIHLRRFANLFQELGAAYQFGVAHRKTVRVLFDALVVMYWERLRFWIMDYRAHVDPTLYARFETLYREVKSHEKGDRHRADYLIAYGSLMGVESLGAGLGRPVAEDELIPIILRGWVRRWTIGERVRSGSGADPLVAAFLDVEREPGASARAVMVRVTERELLRLDRREKNYDRIDVHSDVRLIGDRPVTARARVWCFAGRPEHKVEPGRADVVILGDYVEKVVRAARRIDPDQEAELRATVDAASFEVVPGPYEFVDEAQAALV